MPTIIATSPTLQRKSSAKTATEGVQAYRERQYAKGARNLSVVLDAETAAMLDGLLSIRKRRGKTGVVAEAIWRMHQSLFHEKMPPLAKRSKSEAARAKLLALRRRRTWKG